MRNYCLYFLAVCSLVLPFSVQAMTVSPLGFTFTAEPNSADTMSLEVRNTNTSERTYQVFVESVSSNTPLDTWITVPEELKLDAGAARELELPFIVPATAVPGERLGNIIIRETSIGGSLQSEVEAAIPVSIIVAGDIYESLAITTAELSLAEGVLSFDVQLKNSGNISIPVQGEITATADTDTAFTSQAVDTLVAPGSSARFTYAKPLSPWYVGRVSVRLDAVYGATNTSIAYTDDLFIVGVGIRYGVGAFCLVLLLFGILVWRNRTSRYESSD